MFGFLHFLEKWLSDPHQVHVMTAPFLQEFFRGVLESGTPYWGLVSAFAAAFAIETILVIESVPRLDFRMTLVLHYGVHDLSAHLICGYDWFVVVYSSPE